MFVEMIYNKYLYKYLWYNMKLVGHSSKLDFQNSL